MRKNWAVARLNVIGMTANERKMATNDSQSGTRTERIKGDELMILKGGSGDFYSCHVVTWEKRETKTCMRARIWEKDIVIVRVTGETGDNCVLI